MQYTIFKYYYFRLNAFGFILFLYHLFLCDVDNIYISILLIVFTQCFFKNITCHFIWTMSLQSTFKQAKTKKLAFTLKRNKVMRCCHLIIYSEK